MSRRLLVLTAAWPSPTEPRRAPFIESLHRAFGEATLGSWTQEVLAPRIRREDPRREGSAELAVRRFAYASGGRRLKESRGLPWFAVCTWLISAAWATWRAGRRRGVDAIVCHWVLPSAVAGRFAARLLGVPYVVWLHGSDLQVQAGRSRLSRAVTRWALAEARHVYAVSAALRDLARDEYGVREDRVSVLPMGVESHWSSDDRPAARARLGLDGGCHLLFVGDLSRDKGLDSLLDAIDSSACGGERELTLWVAGSGPLRAEIESRSTRSPQTAAGETRPRARALGVLSATELAEWYRAADALVLPSLSEGTPLVVLEALASGLPVLATRVGGIPEVVRDGVDGLLFDAGDAAGLCRAIALLRDHPDRARELAAAARERGLGPTVAQRAQVLDELLEDILQGEAA